MAKVRIGAIDKNLANKAKKYKELTDISTVTLVENMLPNINVEGDLLMKKSNLPANV